MADNLEVSEGSSGKDVRTTEESSNLHVPLNSLYADDGNGSYGEIHRRQDSLQSAIEHWNAGQIGISSLPTPVQVDATQNGNVPSSIDADNVGLSKEATLSSVDTAIGSQGDAPETDTSNNASLIAFVQGVVDLLGGTVTVADNGAFTITIDGDNVGLAKESTLSNQLTQSRFNDVVNQSDEIKTTTSVSVSDVLIRAINQSGTEVDLEAIDDGSGNYLLRVADENLITAADGNTIVVHGEDSQGTDRAILTDTNGVVVTKEEASSSYYNSGLSNAAQEISAEPVELTGVWLGNAANSTEAVYIKFFDQLATNVDLTADSPVVALQVPTETGGTLDIPSTNFSTALSVAAVTEAGTGNTAPSTAPSVNVWYR